MRSLRTLLISSLAICVGLFLFWPRPPVEQQIRATLDALATAATFEGALHPVALAQQSTELSKQFFAEQVTFEVTYQGEDYLRNSSRKEIAQQMAMGRQMLAQLATRVESVSVVLKDRERATATFQLRGMGREVGGAATEYFLEIFEVTAELERGSDDEWRIVKVVARDLRHQE